MTYNCQQCVSRPIIDTLSNRLRNLLQYFEEPDNKHMRTFISPERAASNFHQQDTGITVKQMASSSETTITKVEHSTALATVPSTSVPSPKEDDGITRLIGGRHSALKKHHYQPIETVSFASCSTPSRRYSEVALVIWLRREQYPTSYLGDRYRIIISLMYDAEEDIWSVSSKFIKRANYHKVDDEDSSRSISNRLCSSSDLRHEIKKMLLFVGISPREVYKIFRKTMEQELVITKSEYGFTTVEGVLHKSMMKDLEESSSYDSVYRRPSSSYSSAHDEFYSRRQGRDPVSMARQMARSKDEDDEKDYMSY